MTPTKLVGLAAALCIAAPLALAGPASAKSKKMSYEDAWAFCKKEVTSVLGGDPGTTAARYTRGAACMKQHGYRLKKSSMSSM